MRFSRKNNAKKGTYWQFFGEIRNKSAVLKEGLRRNCEGFMVVLVELCAF